jgi:hypothetical protein
LRLRCKGGGQQKQEGVAKGRWENIKHDASGSNAPGVYVNDGFLADWRKIHAIDHQVCTHGTFGPQLWSPPLLGLTV